jgi:hypothetical protein
MKGYKIILLLSGMLLLNACNEEYLVYNDLARLQFGPVPSRMYQASFNYADTLKTYTFFYEPSGVVQDTLYFDLYAIGGPSNTDRPFRLEQVQAPDTLNAVAGTHYIGFNDNRVANLYVIPAGEVHLRLPIVTLRDPSLKQQGVILRFQVVQNEHFAPGDPKLTWRMGFITERLSRPAAWIGSYGPYSEVKHAWMIQATGQRWDQEFMAEIMSDFSNLSFWIATLKMLLLDYNNANPGSPLTDEFGELVFFP